MDGTDSEFDTLLKSGGDLIWMAGPLAKGPCLCHGTAGNGYAFLRLFEKTGEGHWQQRARSFAMHAIHQSDASAVRRFSLWTGDLGVAVYVAACLRQKPGFPSMELF